MPIPFDPNHPDMGAVRRIFLDMLRANPTIEQLPHGSIYDSHVEYVNGNRQPNRLAFIVYNEVFWQLVLEGVLAPGKDPSNQNVPWFHVTEYGKKVLREEPAHPHDSGGYLEKVRSSVSSADATVMAYLSEALMAFGRGVHVASMVMLGIAAERVFLLVCESLLAALKDQKGRKDFEDLLQRFPMKPKLEWAHAKLNRTPGLPEGAVLMITAIYDLLRTQRNDLGHPREMPPKLDREQAFVNLQIFPRFYKAAEELRQFLTSNQA